MPAALLSPVFTAEARALTDFFDGQSRTVEADSFQLAAMLKTVLPDILETPARMRRLNDALVEWLMSKPRPAREVDDAREGFSEILRIQAEFLTRVLHVAKGLEFSPQALDALNRALEELHQIRDLAFRNWQPFTRAEFDSIMSQIRNGQGDDLDEVIRELQGRAQ